MKLLEKIGGKLRRLTTKPEEFGEYSGGLLPHKIRELAFRKCSDFTKSINRELKLLEVGCGEGLFLKMLADNVKNFELFGVDILVNHLEQAERRLHNNKNFKLKLAKGQELPFENSFFDFVVCINTLYNLPAWKDVKISMQEASRVCKPNGFLVFDIRNAYDPLTSIRYMLAKYYDPTVTKQKLGLHVHTLSQIRCLLKEFELTIINKTYIRIPFWPIPAAILIIARKKN